jgi:hypothetical protein
MRRGPGKGTSAAIETLFLHDRVPRRGPQPRPAYRGGRRRPAGRAGRGAEPVAASSGPRQSQDADPSTPQRPLVHRGGRSRAGPFDYAVRGGAHVSRAHCHPSASGRWRDLDGRADRHGSEDASCGDRCEAHRPDNPGRGTRKQEDGRAIVGYRSGGCVGTVAVSVARRHARWRPYDELQDAHNGTRPRSVKTEDRGLATGERHGPGVLHALQRRQTCVLTLPSVVTFPISSSPITGGSP